MAVADEISLVHHQEVDGPAKLHGLVVWVDGVGESHPGEEGAEIRVVDDDHHDDKQTPEASEEATLGIKIMCTRMYAQAPWEFTYLPMQCYHSLNKLLS